MKQAIFGVFLAAVALLAASSRVDAATQTIGPTSFGTYSAGAGGSFGVSQFDPSLGTLFKVELFVDGYSDGGSNALENLSANAGQATVRIGTDITVSGPAALTVITLPQTVNSGPISAFDGTIDFGGASAIQVIGVPSFDSQSDSITLGLAPYIGLGLINFNYGSVQNTSNSATVAPTTSLTSPSNFGFDVTVVYHYNPVPEPASVALMGFGALALVGYGWKRRARA